jgi:hypothetical protein
VGEPVSPLTQLLRSLTKLRVELGSGSSRCCRRSDIFSTNFVISIVCFDLTFYSSGTATILQC